MYSVYGVDIEGNRDVLGIYLLANEWGLILEDIKHRGVSDIFFICVDGLKGFNQVINAVFPSAIIQRCIVNKIRNSVRFISYKDRESLCSCNKTCLSHRSAAPLLILQKATRKSSLL